MDPIHITLKWNNSILPFGKQDLHKRKIWTFEKDDAVSFFLGKYFKGIEFASQLQSIKREGNFN